MRELLREVIAATDRSAEIGVLTANGKRAVIEHMGRLYEALYHDFSEMRGVDELLQDRILTYSEEVAEKVRKEEESKRKAEEVKRKAEEVKRKAADSKRKAADSKRKAAEQRLAKAIKLLKNSNISTAEIAEQLDIPEESVRAVS
jgi:septal ring factor EnvC (AmiA/AmiB activator)